MAKYYFCESVNGAKFINRVTPVDSPNKALELAKKSTNVKFISTVNPFSNVEA